MRFLYPFFGILLFSCSQSEKNPPILYFTTHGIVIEHMEEPFLFSNVDEEEQLSYKKMGSVHVVEHRWKPNKRYTITADGESFKFISPQEPSPYVLDRIELEDATQLAASGNFPDTDITISPNQRYVAIATYFGYIRLYDLETGEVIWKKKISEGMAKKIAFMDSSRVLIVGEQSFDGFVYGMQVSDGTELWRYRLANDLDESSPPNPDDIYGIYSLPGVFHIKILDDKEAIIAGLHSWYDGKKSNKRSRLYSFKSNGDLNWTYPDKPIQANIQYFDANTDYILFSISRILGNEKTDMSENSLVLLNSKTGRFLDSHEIAPLKPHFDRVSFWQSVSVDHQSRFANLGTYDGRAFIFPIEENRLKSPHILTLGTPIFMSKIPVMAGIAFTNVTQDEALFSVNQSSVPYSFSRKNKISKPPSTHPSTGSIVLADQHGKIRWKYQDGFVYSAVHVSENAEWMLATIDDKPENKQRNRYGYSLFQKQSDDLKPYKKIYTYNSGVPVFFRGAISHNGRLKVVVTSPYFEDKTKSPTGKYEVHITL